MELARQEEGRAESEKDQGAPGVLAHRPVEMLDGLGMLGEPGVQRPGSAEDAEQGEQPDAEQGDQLHQGFEGDGHHQSTVLLPRRDVACAEEDGEGSEGDAEAQRQYVGRRLLREHLQGLGDGADLQGDVGQGAHQHEQGDQYACQLAAIAEGEEVGQRAELVFAGEPQDGTQQDGAHGQCQGYTQVDGEEQVAAGAGKADTAVIGPGGGIDAQGECVGEGVRYPARRNQPAIRDVGNEKQQHQVAEAGEEQGGEFQRHRSGFPLLNRRGSSIRPITPAQSR